MSRGFSNIALGKDVSSEDLNKVKQLFPVIPRSAMGQDANKNYKYGLGNFVIHIKVTGYDDFAKRIIELEKGIDMSKGGIIKQFTDGI